MSSLNDVSGSEASLRVTDLLSYRLIEVQKLTQQVVSGMIYTITGIFEDKDKAQFTCEITIWERAWLDEADQLTFKVKSKTALVADGNSGSGSSTGTGASEF